MNKDYIPKNPEIVIIVPYRDRNPQKKVFETMVPMLFEDYNYLIIFVHQNDNRPFNRGAMKNIGFLIVKCLYPKSYENITIVFHDIDNIAYKKDQFNYNTQKGIIKHFYGFRNTLGGIFSIKATDFEKINGFPNIWTWGLEDNILQKRCLMRGFKINRQNFILSSPAASNNMILLWSGWKRLIDPTIKAKIDTNSIIDGIKIIKNLKYNIVAIKNKIIMANIENFVSGENVEIATRKSKQLNCLLNSKFKRRRRAIKAYSLF